MGCSTLASLPDDEGEGSFNSRDTIRHPAKNFKKYIYLLRKDGCLVVVQSSARVEETQLFPGQDAGIDALKLPSTLPNPQGAKQRCKGPRERTAGCPRAALHATAER